MIPIIRGAAAICRVTRLLIIAMYTFSHTLLHRCTPSPTVFTPSRGRILGRNPDKCLQSFPYLLFTVTYKAKLCLEESISSNSRNLFHILEFSHKYTVWKKEENLIENHTPSPRA